MRVKHRSFSVFVFCLYGCGCLTGTIASAADDKKSEDKTPKLLVAAPLGVVPGMSTKLMLRGLRIDEATEVRASIGEKQLETKLLAKQKNNLGTNLDPKLGGDSQVDVELTVPSEAVGSPENPATLHLVVVTSAGVSEPYELPLASADQIDTEQEPNDGFDSDSKKGAQPIAVGKVLLGRIERGQDVDVYSIESTPGQRLIIEVTARRLGSPLDASLTLFDQHGTILATSDDSGDSTDSQIEFTSPGGKLYIVVSDANDQGSAAHGYRLTARQ
jgi:hypothetical protein